MKKRKLKINKKYLIMLVIIGVLLIGCISIGVASLFKNDDNKSNITDKKDNNDKDKNEEEPIVPKVQVVNVNSKSRPYAVMINNLGTARPYHTGLQDAYLVYEMVVEGGITRYLALFKDKPLEVVGNVRSSRHYYLDYALENDAYYVHWGWSPQAQSDISSLKINNLNGLYDAKPYFFRQNLPVSSEHTAFVNLKEMENLVKKKGYRTETNKDLLLNYSATNIDTEKIVDKKEAINVDIKNSKGFTTNYVYDSSANVYKQYVNNKEHKDYATKEQYTVKNIIAYQIKYNNISGDDKGRQDIDNIGKGEGYFITNGVAMPITWEKKSRDSQTIYRYKDGTEITVNDGNTWIHIVPTSGNISIS